MSQEQEEKEGTMPPSATSQEMAEEEVDLQPPLRVPKPASSRMGIGGGIGKTALVSAVVAMLLFIVMGMAGGGSFVTKKDFETNIANMAVTVNDATASVNNALASVNSAVQGLPSTIESKVNSAISQQTSDINQSISQISASVSTLSGDVSALSTKMDENMADLDEKIAGIQTQMDDFDDRLTVLETVKEEEEEEVASEFDKDDIALELVSYDLSVSSADATATVGLYFENESEKEIRVTKVSLVIYPASLSTGTTLTLTNYSSTVPLNWSVSKLGTNFWFLMGNAFASIGGWKIPEDDSREAFLSLVFDATELSETPMAIAVELNDFDFEVVD